ncbi:MAG: hypothetical protein ABW061_15740 [Polyangiaceae bacterium]
MTILELTIEAELCGPISMGTVAVVRALMDHSGLPLEAAVALVDRCAFFGERVAVPLPSHTAAEALLQALTRVPAAPRIRAAITS